MRAEAFGWCSARLARLEALVSVGRLGGGAWPSPNEAHGLAKPAHAQQVVWWVFLGCLPHWCVRPVTEALVPHRCLVDAMEPGVGRALYPPRLRKICSGVCFALGV